MWNSFYFFSRRFDTDHSQISVRFAILTFYRSMDFPIRIILWIIAYIPRFRNGLKNVYEVTRRR